MNKGINLCLVGLIVFLQCYCKNAKISIYPSPGDLSDIEGLHESPVFDVNVNSKDAFVYQTLEVEPQKHSAKGV